MTFPFLLSTTIHNKCCALKHLTTESPDGCGFKSIYKKPSGVSQVFITKDTAETVTNVKVLPGYNLISS